MNMRKGTLSAHRPLCPFCDRPVEPPKELEPRRLGDFGYGSCECGAVYVYDVTGHNLGAAMVEALGFACNDDWDLAWSLLPEEDYQDALVERYDEKTHLVHPGGRDPEGRKITGVLSFIRLHREVGEVTRSAVKKRLESKEFAAASGHKGKSAPTWTRHRYGKREVAAKVAEGDLEELIDMAHEDRLVLRKIQRLLYSADDAVKWKAVIALGVVAGAVASNDPATAGDLLRRLHYSATDSAATSRGAIETMGEIIRARPDTFGSFVRHLLAFLSDPAERPAVLWAIGRIGEVRPDLVRSSAFFAIFDMLTDDDPVVRGHAAWALGLMKAREALSAIKKLETDRSGVTLFDGEAIRDTTVADLAREALARMALHEISTEEKGKMVDERSTGADMTDELKQAYSLYKEAEMLSARGMSLDAMKKFEEALEIYDAAGDDVRVANICEKLGDCHLQRGNFKAALPLYQRSLTICEKSGDPISTVILVEKITDLYRKLDQLDKALPYYYKALEIAEELRDAGRAGLYLSNIGDIYQKKGDLENALDAYRTALSIFKNTGSGERAGILEKGIAALEARMKGPECDTE